MVRPVGELDLSGADRLQAALSDVVDGAPAVVVVDLEQATFVDSMILGVLLSAARRLQQTGGRLRIVCTSASLARIFEMTLLNQLLAIYSSVDAALGDAAPE